MITSSAMNFESVLLGAYLDRGVSILIVSQSFRLGQKGLYRSLEDRILIMELTCMEWF